MDFRDLVESFKIEIDDIRWYLSAMYTERLFVKFQPDNRANFTELVRYVWSGEMADDLYEMEDEFIRHTQSRLDRGTLDMPGARQLCRDIIREREKRYQDAR